MPLFVSYSHSDKEFVDRLALEIVKENGTVWVDRWEINVGDSILQKVQNAILTSSGLLVVLSKASVQSEWCKKELGAGLMRELEEKRVLVLPVLVEDCSIPIFLREKMYADFRTSFVVGLKAVLDSTRSISNQNQSRVDEPNYTLDWAIDWGMFGSNFTMRFTIIEASKDAPMSILTEIVVIANPVATARYVEFDNAGLDWCGRGAIAEMLFDLAEKTEMRVVLEDQFPEVLERVVQDSTRGASYDVRVTSRRLGVDNGKVQVVHVGHYLRNIRDYVKSSGRPLTPDEVQKLMAIISDGLSC